MAKGGIDSLMTSRTSFFEKVSFSFILPYLIPQTNRLFPFRVLQGGKKQDFTKRKHAVLFRMTF